MAQLSGQRGFGAADRGAPPLAEPPRAHDAAVPGTRDVVGHTLLTYLPRSCTFVHTTIRFQRGFRPVVLAAHTENVNEFPADELYRLARPSSFARRAARRLWAGVHGFEHTYDHGLARAARRSRCALLHAHFGWAGCAALPARRRLGIPLVTTFYGHDLSDSRGLDYARLFSDSTLVVCEGPAMHQHLVELHCPASRIRTVPIGLDLAQFPFAARTRSRPLVLLQTCRFVEKKGVDLSLRAFAAARQRLGPSELWLVGDGELRTELASLADRLGVSRDVRFLGMLSHAQYREAARRAHICLQPSRTASTGDTEGGAPTVILEMQAIGVPVVSTRHADIPFVVAEPERLVAEEDVDALADALVRLSNADEDEWAAAALHARSFVEARHDARVVAGELEGVYREAIATAYEPTVRRAQQRRAVA
jgi:colanic acid/amylovoran biosynthesis glycosyltransferase